MPGISINQVPSNFIEYGGNWYGLTPSGSNWEEAQAYAMALGGNLVTIQSPEENAWLVNSFGDGYWIGLNDLDLDGVYSWASGESLSYSNWEVGQPSMPSSFEVGVWFWSGLSGKWDNAPNEYQLRGIVELQITSGDVPVKNSINSHYYKAVPENVTWEVAFGQANQASYRGLQGYLVTVTSPEEDRFVHNEVVNKSGITGWGSFAGYQGTWLGASDRDQEGTWKWMNGPEEDEVFATSSGARNITSTSGNYSNFLPSVHEGNTRTDFDFLVSQVPRTSTSVPSGWTNYLFWDDIPTNIGSAEVREYGAYGYGVGNGYVIEYGGLPATYSIVASKSSVNEGDSITFDVLTTNVEWGTSLNYSISGISAEDLSSGALNGSMVVKEGGESGKASITLSLSADQLTEGAEVLTFTVNGQSESVTVNDTSVSLEPTYNLVSLSDTVDEGSSAKFILTSNPLQYNASALTNLSFRVSGVSPSDVLIMEHSVWPIGIGGGWPWTWDENGQEIISIPVIADNLTEGNETLTVTVENASATVIVNDSSKTPIPPNDNFEFIGTETLNFNGVGRSSKLIPGLQFDLVRTDAVMVLGKKAVLNSDDVGDVTTNVLSALVFDDAWGGLTFEGELLAYKNSADDTFILRIDDSYALIDRDQIDGVTFSAWAWVGGDYRKDEQSWVLKADSDSFDEGEIATFTLSTTNVEEGTSVNYTLSGISPSDVKAGLSGKVEIDTNGQALIAISILADSKTEGDETLTVTVEDQSASVLIRDTSKNPAGVTPGKRANSSANENFEAAAGETKLEFAGNSGNFKVRSNDGGKTWELSSPDTGTDTVTGFKRIALDDKTIALDFQAGDAGYSSVMLIGAAFGKDLVPTYFSAGLTFFDAGLDTAYLCDLIQSAGLIESQIGQTSTGAWIRHVYKNVVGVFPDELTELVFTDLIDSGVYTRATLLKAAAELSLLESQVDITGLQSTGLTYTPFG